MNDDVTCAVLWFDLRRPSDTFIVELHNVPDLLWFDLRRPSDTFFS